MTKLSICIPTYNRIECLNNCLNSILIAKKNNNFDFEVCISDNCSKTNIKELVDKYSSSLDITFNENLNKNFIKILTEKLLKWTGERWIISLSKEQGEETVYEKNFTNRKEKIAKEMNGQLVKDFTAAFPDAKLVDVTEDHDA